jgi:hypothetical protein
MKCHESWSNCLVCVQEHLVQVVVIWLRVHLTKVAQRPWFAPLLEQILEGVCCTLGKRFTVTPRNRTKQHGNSPSPARAEGATSSGGATAKDTHCTYPVCKARRAIACAVIRTRRPTNEFSVRRCSCCVVSPCSTLSALRT